MRGKILLASAVALVGFAFAESSASAQQNEHYACYQLKHKFPKGQTATVSNDVEASGAQGKCKLKNLCVPTQKDGGGTNPNGSADYLMWQCKGTKPVVALTVTDQFAGGAASTKKFKFLLNLADSDLH